MLGALLDRASIFVAPAKPFLGAAWKAAPWLGCIGLGFALMTTRATLSDCRKDATIVEMTRKAADEKARADAAERKQKATEDYALRELAREPIILHSRDTVTRYEQTAAGRLRCLDAERVRGIEELDRDLAAPAGADPVPDTVPDHPG